MRAAVLRDPGTGPELTLDQVPMPVPGPGEVLVEVAAFSLNNAEMLQIRGALPAPPGAVPGLECAGTVRQVGAGVTRWHPGDRVAALTRAGSYAEYVVVPAGACLALPDELDFVAAAAIPEAAATAWWNLVHRGRISPGERVLVHGAAGGVGTVAVQLAVALGAWVVGSARGPVKAALATQLGCAHVVDHTGADPFGELAALAPGGLDVILDNQGAATLADNLAALAPGGRLVVIGVAGGTSAMLDLGAVMAAGVEISSSSLGRLDDEVRAALCREVEDHVLPRVLAGRVRPVLDRCYPVAELSSALARFGDPERVGKVVVTVSPVSPDPMQRNGTISLHDARADSRMVLGSCDQRTPNVRQPDESHSDAG
jgi:NADPH:quinone reductase